MLESNHLKIYNKVCELIFNKLENVEVKIYSEDSLFEDGIGLDSINYVELICELENEFQIVIMPAEFTEIHTLNELVTLINQKLE